MVGLPLFLDRPFYLLEVFLDPILNDIERYKVFLAEVEVLSLFHHQLYSAI